ncbi:suppressor of cytokine signaling 6 [Sabethes cyaneus]|uniref:suppressor of cytokine signaling 6 n=1 Tax=Sabethes cyaneus TaxID=53552 RepID=UPI00237DADD3|nr:suppressor of cytokine signaling 6 [Sabethes cyaneus]
MEDQSDSMYRFKWFMSLSRRRSPRMDLYKENNSADKLANNNNGMFFTLRKRFQTKLTSIKVKAYEPKIVSIQNDSSNPPESDRTTNNSFATNNDFARIVIERHSQNPIRFSSPDTDSPEREFSTIFTSTSNTDSPATTVFRPELNVEVASSLDTMMEEMRNDLLKYGWYWGKLTRAAAQKRLARQDNGTFLVRDSQTEKYQFTVSFRSSGITLHCRIDYKNKYWSFSGLTTPTQCETMIDLIEDTMKKSEFGIIGFVKQTSPLTPPFPVRLTKPINRFYEVSSLQHLCRFIIRQRIDSKNIIYLPLPSKLKEYIDENFHDI